MDWRARRATRRSARACSPGAATDPSGPRGPAARSRAAWRTRTGAPRPCRARARRRPRGTGPPRSCGRARPCPACSALPVPVGRDLVQVLVDQALVRLGVQRLAHHTFGELDRDLGDLAAQLLEHPVALGPDLVLRLGDRGRGLLLGLGLDLGADLFGRPPGLLDDAVGLLARRRELLPVLGELLFGVAPGPLGALELAL